MNPLFKITSGWTIKLQMAIRVADRAGGIFT